MNSTLILLSLLTIGCSVAQPVPARAQSDGCTLSSWVMQQAPHSTRTLEQGPPSLRDTQIVVGGVSHRISLPDGFTMSVFAKISQCRGLACSPDGVIYATSYNGNIYALPDHNHDGLPDSTIVVAQGYGNPHGIGFYDGDMYFSNEGNLYRVVTCGSDRVITATLQVATFKTGGHNTRNFVIDSVKRKFYIQVGSASNMDATDTDQRACIVEMNPDGSGRRKFASGLRNPVGMDLDPRTGALWVNNNGMDNLFSGIFPSIHQDSLLSDNNPSECVYLVCDGANYGWPYCYGFQMRNPQAPWVNLDTNVVKTFSGPVAEVLAHEAPLGLHFYRGTAFPAMYHNAIFQCYHGSWNRYPPAPPRITVMWADSDGHNARVTDFVNGFFVMGSKPDSGNGTYFGRPVSIIEGGDSALYVSDDAAGIIYRIQYTGQSSGSVSEPTHSELKHSSIGEIVPDPAGDKASIDISLNESSLIKSDLFDATGKLISPIRNEVMSPGAHALTLDTSTLPSGSYVLQITTPSEVISKRFVVAH